MKQKSKIFWITRTAALIALLVAAQAVTAPLGNTIITGTLVNAILIVAVLSCGLGAGACVAVISPIMAKLSGIGPLWSLIPFIALGNLTLVSVWLLAGKWCRGSKKYMEQAAVLVFAAAAKFLVLYLGIVKLAVPVILGLPEPQATVISGTFSLPQLVTALLGGVLALPVTQVLKKAGKIKEGSEF